MSFDCKAPDFSLGISRCQKFINTYSNLDFAKPLQAMHNLIEIIDVGKNPLL
jgi:hypothetical protein